VIREEPESPENAERWLLSYADFITLLMVFFVVLYAMSQIDANKYETLSHSLNAALSGGTGILDSNSGVISPDSGGDSYHLSLSPPSSSTAEEAANATEANQHTAADTSEVQSMEKLEGVLKTYFAEHLLENAASMNIDERGLVISLNDTILFDLGSAEIKSDSRRTVVQVGEALNTLDNYIRVEGHTDNLPIKTAQYASNWELSATRATHVVRLLIDQANVPPQKLSAVGYGEYKPVADNVTTEGRGRNRRVDIILLSGRYNELENIDINR
jgi:chemotaxis protein MotB